MTEEAKKWLEEISKSLAPNRHSEETILGILANVWLDGYQERQKDWQSIQTWDGRGPTSTLPLYRRFSISGKIRRSVMTFS